MKDQWKSITDYPVIKYSCGLSAGDRVRLRKDIIDTNNLDAPILPSLKMDQIWEVIPGSDVPPIVVWFRRTDGERHTGDDAASIFEYVELLPAKLPTAKRDSV